MTHPFDARPLIVAIAGPNGAGKSTFYEAHLRDTGLRYVNADDIARALDLGAYDAAALADVLRRRLVQEQESFIFETVFSDPHGEKVAFLVDAVARGYTVVLCFIGLDTAATSEARVTMRVMQGGHDVPTDELVTRFGRSLANLARAIDALPYVLVYDNADLCTPFRKVASFARGAPAEPDDDIPAWLASVIAATGRG